MEVGTETNKSNYAAIGCRKDEPIGHGGVE